MRIYGFTIIDFPADAFGEPEEDGLSSMLEGWEPAGWAEHCQEEYGETRKFFWPSERKMFRSRSAAQMRVDIVQRWGGKAILLEGSVSWTTVAEANASRKRQRDDARIEKLRAQIRKIEES